MTLHIFDGGTLNETDRVLVGCRCGADGHGRLLTRASGQSDGEAAPIFGIKIPPGYRDWKLISVAHEAGKNNDLRAILGNDAAVKAYRECEAAVPGRNSYCPAGLALRFV